MSTSTTPLLTLLSTLPSPSGHGTRAWQSKPHPSPSHPVLATASSDKSVHVWSLRDFRLLSTISNGHKRSIRTVDWKDYGEVRTADGGRKRQKLMLATGSFDANVGIWEHNQDYETGTASRHNADEDDMETDITKNEAEEDEEWAFTTLLTGPDSEIKSIHFSPPHYSANFLATSSRDKSVWVWEEVEDEEWETVAVLQEHAGDVKCVVWCEGARLPPFPDAGEERIVGSREILASSSYDDTVRLWRDVESEGDWVCVGVLEGHAGTVWSVSWEKHINISIHPNLENTEVEWEPRLISCSDDLSVRVWCRQLSEGEKEEKRNQLAAGSTKAAPRLPSTIRPTGTFERWAEDSVLPAVHVRSVYAVDWSRQTGLIVSCGGDGTIAVYKEVPFLASTASAGDGDVPMNGTFEHPSEQDSSPPRPASKWEIVAQIESAHDEYEVNHVCFAPRRDRDTRFEQEEVIVSTGDEGDVKVWILPAELIRP